MFSIYLNTRFPPSLIFWSILDLVVSTSTVIYSYFRPAFSSSFISDLHRDMVTFIVTLFSTTVPVIKLNCASRFTIPSSIPLPLQIMLSNKILPGLAKMKAM